MEGSLEKEATHGGGTCTYEVQYRDIICVMQQKWIIGPGHAGCTQEILRANQNQTASSVPFMKHCHISTFIDSSSGL